MSFAKLPRPLDSATIPPAPASAVTPAGPAGVRSRVGVTLTRAGGRHAEVVTFVGLPDPGEHIAIVLPPPRPGPVSSTDAPMVRVHSECLTGDVLGSGRCDCGSQLDDALQFVAEAGGVVLYLRQEGRGIGLYNKLDAYVLQDRGADTFEANQLIGREVDERDYGVAAMMLVTLGISEVRLLTNNPDKTSQLRAHGIDVVSVIPTAAHVTPENARYLEVKASRGGHTIALGGSQ